MSKRIQRRRTRGWRMPGNTVYVGRPSRWGNPFVIGKTIACDSQADAVAMHRDWLEDGATAPYPLPGESKRLSGLRERVLEDIRAELGGKDLACWCALDQPCHADVLLEAAAHD